MADGRALGASWTVEKNTVTLTVRAKIAADLLLLRRADEVIGKILSQVFRRDAAVQIISREQERELESFLEERRRMDAELLKHMGDQVKEKKKPEGPRVLYGRKITGSTFDPIGDLNETSGRVCVEGFVLKKIESKELRGGSKTLVTFGVTDYTGSILCKVFLNAEQGEGKEIQGLKAGIRVRVRGARKAAMDSAKKLKAENIVTEDGQRDLETQIQKLTDKYVKEIDELVTVKEKDIMTI